MYLYKDVISTAPSINNMAGIVPGTIQIPSTSTSIKPSTASTENVSSGNVKEKARPKLPSFWIPTLTPSAKPTEIKKPVRSTYSTHVHFTCIRVTFIVGLFNLFTWTCYSKASLIL